MEAIYRADFHTIGIFAFNATLSNNKWHRIPLIMIIQCPCRAGANHRTDRMITFLLQTKKRLFLDDLDTAISFHHVPV